MQKPGRFFRDSATAAWLTHPLRKVARARSLLKQDVARGRSPPDSAAGHDGASKDRVALSCMGSYCPGGLMRAAHLTQDLSLTQNLGVESSRHAVEVKNGGSAIESGENSIQADTAVVGELPEPWLEVVAAGPVDLESIAGGEDGGAAAGGAPPLEPRGHLVRREDQEFPDPH